MATAVIMPRQGQSVETCIITKWFRSRGESVATGDILFSYETDKAAFDLESPAEGILLDIFFGEGAEVPVLSNVAVIGKSGEATESFKPGAAAGSAPAAILTEVPEIKVSAPYAAQPEVIANGQGSRVRISPRAIKLAQEKGVDFRSIAGSGPNGRIVSADIERAQSGSLVTKTPERSSGVEYSEKPLSNVRKLISKAMHASLQNSAQLTHHMSADVRKLLGARAKIKEKLASDKTQPDITLNDMV
jgi:pyruvate dehydrogenase E2 component (dihydrolipoamide acetyltransferase)